MIKKSKSVLAGIGVQFFANTLALAKGYTDLLDEVYKGASVTADLTSDSTLIRAGANVNELLYPQIVVTGLGDYDRNSGYTNGAVNLVWKTATFNYDRGTKIAVDVMDDQETFNLSFGAAGAELQRTKVAPEADAFTFCCVGGYYRHQRSHRCHLCRRGCLPRCPASCEEHHG